MLPLRITGMWVRNEEALKFCYNGICSLITSVTRSQGGTAGLGEFLSVLISGCLCQSSDIPATPYKTPCALLRLALLSLGLTLPLSGACLSEVQLTHHCSLQFLPSFLLEVKCCIIYTTSLVACILFESWCCADFLRDIEETEKQQLCSHDYLFSQESNKSEETSNWMEHCERRDDTARDCITSQRSHIRTFQWLSNFFISSVNSCWARATSFHLAASHFFLEVRGQILPVPHCSTMRSNCSKPLWHYAALCWASQTLLLSPGTNDVSVFHWLPFY